MEEQVVERRDGVEENALDRRWEELDQGVDAAGLEDGQQTLAVVAQVVEGANGSLGWLLKWINKLLSTILHY